MERGEIEEGLLAGAAGAVAGGVPSTAWALAARSEGITGAAAGLLIAGFDLGVLGSLFPRIRALPLLPQLADHVAYGATVGYVLAQSRR